LFETGTLGELTTSRAPLSRWAGGRAWALLLIVIVGVAALDLSPKTANAEAAIAVDRQEALVLGNRIWRNETGGDPEKLLWWNDGEGFASLGVGHFIWYPKENRGPFEESFPPLLRFLETAGVRLPDWLRGEPSPPCPWPSRQEFFGAGQSPRMRALQELLMNTVLEQASFLLARLNASLPKMLAAVAPQQGELVRKRYLRLAATPAGRYALLDYVNFKGEGVSETERYNGEGWGLLLVLVGMTDAEGTDPVDDFAAAASRVLRDRVENAPPDRREQRWLPGWLKRIRTYSSGFDGTGIPRSPFVTWPVLRTRFPYLEDIGD
jgi:hypothetical protein